MEQKVAVTKFYNLESVINQHIREGWRVTFMCSENVTGPSSNGGSVCVIFEKGKKEAILVKIEPNETYDL